MTANHQWRTQHQPVDVGGLGEDSGLATVGEAAGVDVGVVGEEDVDAEPKKRKNGCPLPSLDDW